MTNYKRIIKSESKKYFSDNKSKLISFFENNETWKIWKYQKLLRKSEFYHDLMKKNKLFIPFYIVILRKKNRLGTRLGIHIPENCFAQGLRIYHSGSIVVNPHAKIGNNCILVGNNFIGNVEGKPVAPVIGDNVMFGWGASAIGNITIPTGSKLGAGSIVVKSIEEENSTILGIPGRIYKGIKK